MEVLNHLVEDNVVVIGAFALLLRRLITTLSVGFHALRISFDS